MTQKKVLIVDDEQHMRTSLRLIVQRLGMPRIARKTVMRH